MMHRWLTVLLVFAMLALSASVVLSQTKAAPGAPYLTVRDVEKITGLHGVKLVPPDPSKGAGGDLNFAKQDGTLLLMVNRSLSSDMFYSQTKNMKGAVKEDIQGVGDAAFIGPPGNYPYYVAFKKGKGSGTVSAFLGFTGPLLPMDQLKKVAQQIAAGM
jgi:hypothetical protein